MLEKLTPGGFHHRPREIERTWLWTALVKNCTFWKTRKFQHCVSKRPSFSGAYWKSKFIQVSRDLCFHCTLTLSEGEDIRMWWVRSRRVSNVIPDFSWSRSWDENQRVRSGWGCPWEDGPTSRPERCQVVRSVKKNKLINSVIYYCYCVFHRFRQAKFAYMVVQF